MKFYNVWNLLQNNPVCGGVWGKGWCRRKKITGELTVANMLDSYREVRYTIPSYFRECLKIYTIKKDVSMKSERI